MRSRWHHKLLLVLALVFGQGLAVAHAVQHPALAAVDQACQLCVHAQDLGGALAGSVPPLAFAATAAPADPPAPVLAPGRAPAPYRSRAPPHLVA